MSARRGRILHLNTFSASDIGGMETHAATFQREMSLGRGWTIETIVEPPLDPSRDPDPDIVMIEAWAWPKLAVSVRSRWPEVPVVARSGGNDAHYALARARAKLTAAGYQSWLDDVVASVDLVIANSQFSARRLRDSDLGPIPATVVTGGAPRVDRRSPRPDGPPKVVVVGRLVDFKGVDDCIDVIAIAQRQLDLELTVVGDGGLRASLEQLAERRLRPNSFRFVGALSHEHCISVISCADLLLSMPRVVWRKVWSERYRHTETMGRSICEAVCIGVPVVAAAVGGVPEVVGPDVGTLVGERDVHAAARAVLDWLSRPKPAPETVGAYRQRLSWPAVLDRYDQRLCELSNRRGGVFDPAVVDTGGLKTDPSRIPAPTSLEARTSHRA